MRKQVVQVVLGAVILSGSLEAVAGSSKAASEHSGTWIKREAPTPSLEFFADLMCPEGERICFERELAEQRRKYQAMRERLAGLPLKIDIRDSNVAWVGQKRCSWEDQTEVVHDTNTGSTYKPITTVINCDGFKPIRLWDTTDGKTASVRFGDFAALYMSSDEWQRRQEEIRKKREYEQLKDW